jgi:hypothetical protein
MAPTEEMTEDSTPVLFNGALETGVCAVVVLDAAYPRSFDIAKLTWCDHLVVHTADIDGPASLHPDIPQRTGELLVRRRLVEDGVNLMRRLHLINATADAGGIRERDLPHPGFLVLDTPLLTYRDPLKSPQGTLAKDEEALRNTALKQHFFNHLAEHGKLAQFIVIENVDLPDNLASLAHVETFTGDPNVPRTGLLPPVGQLISEAC